MVGSDEAVTVGAGTPDCVGSAVADGVGTGVAMDLEQATIVKKSRGRKRETFQEYVVSLPYKLFHHIDSSTGLQCVPRQRYSRFIALIALA